MSLNLDHNQRTAYRIGLAVAMGIAVIVIVPASRPWAIPGPQNVGHEEIACDECHDAAPGTIRQQIQANVRHWLGLRATGARFATLPVDNEDCLDCHQNEADLHPVYRFNEPRFDTVRAAIGAHRCTGCHQQHRGARVTMAITDCRYCHQDTVLKNDPLETSHQTLAAREQWDTCLTCHDFHGNHEFKAPERMDAALDAEAVRNYLEGGPSPYGPRQVTVIDTMRIDP